LGWTQGGIRRGPGVSRAGPITSVENMMNRQGHARVGRPRVAGKRESGPRGGQASLGAIDSYEGAEHQGEKSIDAPTYAARACFSGRGKPRQKGFRNRRPDGACRRVCAETGWISSRGNTPTRGVGRGAQRPPRSNKGVLGSILRGEGRRGTRHPVLLQF